MNQPKLIINPYAFSGKLFDAYSEAFDKVELEDWICFKDGDACFLETSDFGHLLSKYITKYPTTGLFTCYASRCHYDWQRLPELKQDEESISYWAEHTLYNRLAHEQDLDFQVINKRIAGHLIMIKKSVWLDIEELLLVKLETRNKKILGFDTQLSYAVMESGYDIKLMKAMLLFHYCRKLTGKNLKIS